MKSLVAFALALIASPAAFACTCGPTGSYEQQYAAATSVVVVRVVSAQLGNYTPELYDEHGRIDRPEEAVLATVEISEQLKGHLASPPLIVSPPSGQPCHKAIEVGQTYVVFSSGDRPILNNWCNPLLLLEQLPPELLARWRGR